MEFDEISDCFADADTRMYLVQRPTWRSCSDQRIFDMIKTKLNCSATLDGGLIQKIVVPDGVVLRVKSKMKMLGLYKFRQSKHRLNWLTQVHATIRPSQRVEDAVKRYKRVKINLFICNLSVPNFLSVLDLLPPHYLVIHFRIGMYTMTILL